MNNENQTSGQPLTFGQAALAYLSFGFCVIPAAVNKIPLISWKQFQTRKPTPEEIKQWSRMFPSANTAIVTGAISGIVVIDVEKDGDFSPYIKDNTVAVKTGGGGRHFYYQHPGTTIKSPPRIKDLVDIRADGALVVAPPSKHASGGIYEWIRSPLTTKLAPLPLWVIEHSKNKATAKIDFESIIKNGVEVGKRNITVTQYIGKLLATDPPESWNSSALPKALEFNQKINALPLSDEEVFTIFDSISKSEISKRSISKQQGEGI